MIPNLAFTRRPWRRKPPLRPASALAVLVVALLGVLPLGCDKAPSDADATAKPPTATTSTADRSDFLLGGIQVNEHDLDGWFDALERAGMNTVSVTDYARHGDWDDSLLMSEPNPGLLTEIRTAKERDFNVVLILRLALDHADYFPRNRFFWHGMIMPNSVEQRRLWFTHYSAFVRSWAEIAAREGVDALMIGSELNAMASTVPITAIPGLEAWYLDRDKQAERRADFLANADTLAEPSWLRGRDDEDFATYLDTRIAWERDWALTMTEGYDPALDQEAREAAYPDLSAGEQAAIAAINERRAEIERGWRDLIRCVREIYPGRIGYAANFDQYHEVGFWDDLDVIGINAYFQLRHHLLPPADRAALGEALLSGWRRVLDDIDSTRQLLGAADHPVIFTEMGFTFRANSTLEPWQSNGVSMFETLDGDSELIVWQDQPVRFSERAMAVHALHRADSERSNPLLDGILYWKLSTVPSHRDHEPFLVLLDDGPFEDPILEALRGFRH
ncbi:MAG: hypothetical protein AAGD38_16325 [Acidobacteriota bacterium]